MAGVVTARGRAAVVAYLRRDVVTSLVALAAGAVVWELAARVLRAEWLPTFSAVVQRIGDLTGDPRFTDAVVESLRQVVVGYLIAVVLGVGVGVAMGLNAYVDTALKYFLDLALFVPPIIMAPVFLIVFGLSDTTLLSIVVLFASTVIAVNTRAAVAGAELQLRDVGRVFGAGRWTVIGRIVLPAALPLIFVGLHLGIARAVKGMIVGQLFLAVIGIGALSARYQQAFDATGTWSVAVVVIGMSLLLSWLIKIVDVLANNWAYGGADDEDR
ncbi:ABC transporter permease [Jiangella mangrovi]|uniref:NitT/TauT family transport system permease protein n=1 Tax=Jiangella mangrovi TaxID=1524084 RepID=A0A7W9GUW0_9ACTN|nr:ABC transporter permease subunit [Jiangella mangrovi]MBB5790209.1 NitT/TauT family transport system permease protein [Jiangella mangrovi]